MCFLLVVFFFFLLNLTQTHCFITSPMYLCEVNAFVLCSPEVLLRCLVWGEAGLGMSTILCFCSSAQWVWGTDEVPCIPVLWGWSICFLWHPKPWLFMVIPQNKTPEQIVSSARILADSRQEVFSWVSYHYLFFQFHFISAHLWQICSLE